MGERERERKIDRKRDRGSREIERKIQAGKRETGIGEKERGWKKREGVTERER